MPPALVFRFALNSLYAGRQLPRGGRRGPSPPGFNSSSTKGWPNIADWPWGSPQPRRALPLERAERDRGRRRTDAPRCPWARSSPGAAGSPPPSSPPGTAVPPALSAPGTGHHRSSPGHPVQPSALLPSPRSGGAHPGGNCGARPSPPLARRRLSGSGASSTLAGGAGLSAGCPGARQELPRGTPGAGGHLWGPAARERCPARCHLAAAGQRARGSCPAATWTGRREPLSPGGGRIPSALPPTSEWRSGRRAGAHPGGAAAVPPGADFVEVRRGPRAAGAGAAPRGGWSGHRRKRCRYWRKRCLCCRCQQGTRKAGDSVLLLYLAGDETSAPSAATPGAALPGSGVGGNPHGNTAVFLLPFKIRLALSNSDPCFENSVNLRFWVLF